MTSPPFESHPLDYGTLTDPAPAPKAFRCSLVSPMFMYGVENKGGTAIPQLREESFIGAMHYWYRALWGHCRPISQIKEEEKELFGSTEKRGRLKLSLSSIENLQTGDTSFKPHRDEHRTNSKPALKSGDFIVRMPAEFASLFELSCLLGGFGGRSRRGFGAVMIQGRNPESDFPGYLRNALANYLNNESLQIENYGGRAVTVIRFLTMNRGKRINSHTLKIFSSVRTILLN